MDPATQDVSLKCVAYPGGEVVFHEENHGIRMRCDTEQRDHPALGLAQGSPGKSGIGARFRNLLRQQTIQKIDAILSSHPERDERQRPEAVGLRPEWRFQFCRPVHIGFRTATETLGIKEDPDFPRPLSILAGSDTINM